MPGDEGTVVGADERDDGVWYTVEHAPGVCTKWIADFSQDELEWIRAQRLRRRESIR